MADIFAEVTSVGIQGLSSGGTVYVVPGATGSTGPQGNIGATGPTGAAGASGVQGASGISGASGYVGSDGATGAQGVQGASGAQGDRYHTTSTSTFTIGGTGTVTVTTVDLGLDYSIAQNIILAYDGSNHQHGRVVSYNQATGQLVFTKTDASGSGTYSLWQINLDGAVGIQGVQGASGINGATGIQGASGVQGASGSQGIDGATGVQGIDGASGIDGATGAQGIDGATGATGIDGATGVQGASGSTGLTGATGAGPETTTFTTSSTAEVVVDTINASVYRSVKYEMQATSGSDYAVSELRLLVDLPNVFLTEYAGLGSPLGSFASYYSPLSNNYSSPDINNGGLSFWNNTDLTIYTTNANVIEALLSAPVGTVISLNSGALSVTLAAAFVEVNAGVYTATTTTSNSPTTLVTNIVWTGSGDIELRFTPVYSSTTLKWKKVSIEV